MTQAPPPPSGPCPRADLIFRPLGEEWVVYDPVGQQIHILNPTAALLWTLMDGATDRDDLVRRVADAFHDAPELEEVREDVDDALDRFRRAGLLR